MIKDIDDRLEGIIFHVRLGLLRLLLGLCLLLAAERGLEAAALLLCAAVGRGGNALMDGRDDLAVRALGRLWHRVKSGCDDHNAQLVVELLVDGGAEDDVCIRMRRRLHHASCGLDLLEADVR